MIKQKALLLALPLTLFVAGCGGSSSTPISILSASSTTADGLTAQLVESSALISSGSDAAYTLTLTNNTAAAVSVNTQGVTADPTLANADVPATLTVRSSAGSEVYPGATSASPGPPGVGAITVTLQPGQVISQQISVNTLTAVGVYQASAVFTVDQQQDTVGPLTIVVQ